jgi:hypothetical protein
MSEERTISCAFALLFPLLSNSTEQSPSEKTAGPQLRKKFPAFYETRKFITHSQQPATCPYPEPDRFNPCPSSHVSKIQFNIILPSTPGSFKWSPSLRLPH